MYSGFVGTVWSHFFSLLSTIWATYKIYSSTFQYDDFFYVYVGLFLVFANSSLALVRYGALVLNLLSKLFFIFFNNDIRYVYNVFMETKKELLMQNFVEKN